MFRFGWAECLVSDDSKRRAITQVTRVECNAKHKDTDGRLSEMKDDLRLIKSALVGTDMRGGLVNQVNTLADRLGDIVATQKLTDDKRCRDQTEEKTLKEKTKDIRDDIIARYKIAFIAVFGTVIGILLNHFLNL
jgi:hypothetical protein